MFWKRGSTGMDNVIATMKQVFDFVAEIVDYIYNFFLSFKNEVE